MTVSEPHHRPADDAQASLRTQLVGEVTAAQFELESVIADLSRDGAPAQALLESRSQLGALIALRRSMANASPSALAGMRSEVSALVASSQSAGQQARAAIASAPDAAELIDRAKEARAKVEEIMRGMRDFDDKLRFANAEEEAAYRRREEERNAYITSEQAKGTPQGDLNAAGAAVGQMADAAAHGAGDSPEFRNRWDELVASTEKLREAAKANGVSTEEFDRRLREDLRRIMKSKGLTDAQIDAQFAAHPDPLDAAKAYVGSEDADRIEVQVRAQKDDAAFASPIAVKAQPESTPPPLTAAPMAVLRAAGVVMQEDASTTPAHGVTAQVVSPAAPLRLG